MPVKSAITLSEMVLLLLVWGACQSAWRFVVIGGLSAAAEWSFPGAPRYGRDALVAGVLLAVLYALVLLARNVNVGAFKAFELEG